jgi:hypothetical protein
VENREAAEAVEFAALLEGLEAGSRRRFWLIKVALEQNAPHDALELAERLERFITRGVPLGGGREVDETAIAPAGPQPAELDGGSLSDDRKHPAKDATPRVLLDDAARDAFARAAAAGADNRELAERFNLTPRQANGARMGLSKVIEGLKARHGTAGAGADAKDFVVSSNPEIDRTQAAEHSC